MSRAGRSRTSAKRRRGRMVALRVTLGVLLAAALLAGGYSWLSSADFLRVEKLLVAPTDRLTEADVVRALREVQGENLLTLPLEELEARLLSIPWVKEASLHRRFPDALEVRLTEYEPVAVVRLSKDDRQLVAEDGRLLGAVSAQAQGSGADTSVAGGSGSPILLPPDELELEPGDFLPVVLVEAIPVAVRVAQEEVWLEAHPVREIRVDEEGEVTLLLESGTEVRLGDPADLEAKLMVADEIIKRYSREGRRAAYVDVHVPERAVARQVRGEPVAETEGNGQ